MPNQGSTSRGPEDKGNYKPTAPREPCPMSEPQDKEENIPLSKLSNQAKQVRMNRLYEIYRT
jgi:hypothetical protein